MLNEILVEMVAMYSDRVHSRTFHNGYGFTVDNLIDDYWKVAGWTPKTRRIIRRLDDMAYNRAMDKEERA